MSFVVDTCIQTMANLIFLSHITYDMTIFITLIILSITKNECDHDDTIWNKNKQSRFSSTYRFYYYINCDTFGYSHDDIRNISNTYLSKYLNKELRTMISKYK